MQENGRGPEEYKVGSNCADGLHTELLSHLCLAHRTRYPACRATSMAISGGVSRPLQGRGWPPSPFPATLAEVVVVRWIVGGRRFSLYFNMPPDRHATRPVQVQTAPGIIRVFRGAVKVAPLVGDQGIWNRMLLRHRHCSLTVDI